MKTNIPAVEKIQARAYQIYLERGSRHGHDMDDWLQAEYELMQLPIRKIAENAPAKPNGKSARKLALVSVVEAAMLLGAEALPHLKG